ncbi:MAG TPA: hypothetical protein VFN19_04315 [Candidatus Nanopelagicales bacterium]|jgi:hypothetical protein|nr:hypothetical protein [Candidatus Nanopelagicales bacterium]
MQPTTQPDRSRRRRAGWVLPLTLAAALAVTTGEASAGAAGVVHPTGNDQAVAAVRSVAAVASKRAITHGVGQNKPKYNDARARWTYRCVKEQTNFKIVSASTVMWSRGDRIKGFHFKYRLVAQGTAGQPQWWSNWSKNTTASFKQGKTKSIWMNAGGLGQSFSSTASWDMEIKLKYPRSLRKAYRYKYRKNIPSPQCGALS